MKHPLLFLALLLVTSCRLADQYDNICIDEITIDGEQASIEYYDLVAERLSQSPLHFLSEEEALQLTPAQRLRTLEVDISIDCKTNRVEAEVEIDNRQTGRDVWETSSKASVAREEPVERALNKALRKTTAWLDRFSNP